MDEFPAHGKEVWWRCGGGVVEVWVGEVEVRVKVCGWRCTRGAGGGVAEVCRGCRQRCGWRCGWRCVGSAGGGVGGGMGGGVGGGV